MNKEEIIAALKSEDFSPYYKEADKIRKEIKGDDVYIRAIIEFSNYCSRQCKYCGINCNSKNVLRYRMADDEIVETARQALDAGYKTIVLQSGEDSHYTKNNGENLRKIIERINKISSPSIT
ncbi:MAG: radical SAM protein, partial [Anaerovoracaceae bacterium]